MKNFARIIALGAGECCVHRQDTNKVIFDFWMRQGNQVISPSCTKEYDASWVVDRLFDDNDELLAEVAQEVLDLVLHQMELHSEQLLDGVPLVLDGDTINQLYKSPSE